MVFTFDDLRKFLVNDFIRLFAHSVAIVTTINISFDCFIQLLYSVHSDTAILSAALCTLHKSLLGLFFPQQLVGTMTERRPISSTLFIVFSVNRLLSKIACLFVWRSQYCRRLSAVLFISSTNHEFSIQARIKSQQ